jgi:hypothetical protein
MRKIITITALIIVAAIAIAWSTLDRPKTAGKVEATNAPATISPAEIMVKHGKSLPTEHWSDPF